MERKIVGVFNTEEQAVKAIDDLKSQGYSSKDISIITKNKGTMNQISNETDTKAPEGLATGAATGGVVGGVAGLLAGLGLLAIPAVGPILAAGPIAATLTGAAVGAGAGGLVGGLVGLGIPENEAREYDSYVNEGNVLVFVNTDAQRESRVYDIFRKYGSLNSNKYGYNKFTDTASNSTDQTYDNERSMHLREEQLDVNKKRVQSGEVTVHKEIVEDQKTINVPVTREEVVVERHAVTNKQTDTRPIGQDETIRIPVSEERIHVTKTPVVKEEVTIGKKQVRETQQVKDTVKREEAHIDREGSPTVRGEEVLSSRSRNEK